MAKRDRELRQIMQYRHDGMEYALKIVEEKGIEALRKDLKFRKMTFMPLELSTEWINGLMRDIYKKIVNCYSVSAYKVLIEMFGFGKKRLHIFKDGFEETTGDLSTVDVYGFMLYTFEDLAKEYNAKYDMGIDMDAITEGDRNNQNALNAGQNETINYVIDILQRHGHFEAAQLLEETIGG